MLNKKHTLLKKHHKQLQKKENQKLTFKKLELKAQELKLKEIKNNIYVENKSI